MVPKTGATFWPCSALSGQPDCLLRLRQTAKNTWHARAAIKPDDKEMMSLRDLPDGAEVRILSIPTLEVPYFEVHNVKVGDIVTRSSASAEMTEALYSFFLARGRHTVTIRNNSFDTGAVRLVCRQKVAA